MVFDRALGLCIDRLVCRIDEICFDCRHYSHCRRGRERERARERASERVKQTDTHTHTHTQTHTPTHTHGHTHTHTTHTHSAYTQDGDRYGYLFGGFHTGVFACLLSISTGLSSFNFYFLCFLQRLLPFLPSTSISLSSFHVSFSTPTLCTLYVCCSKSEKS